MLHFATPRPGKPCNFCIPAPVKRLSTRWACNDGLHFLQRGVLAVCTVGHWVYVVDGFVSCAVGLIPQFNSLKPFNPRNTLGTGHDQTQGVTVLGAQVLTVLPIGN